MNRRTTYRRPSLITYREHVAAALGCTVGMLAMALFALGLVIGR